MSMRRLIAVFFGIALVACASSSRPPESSPSGGGGAAAGESCGPDIPCAKDLVCAISPCVVAPCTSGTCQRSH